MRFTLLLLCSLFCLTQIHADNFQNKKLGIQFTYTAMWKAGVLDEVNNPFLVFNAANESAKSQFFMLIVTPTAEYEISKERLQNWSMRMMAEMPNVNASNIKKSEIKKFPSGNWYYLAVELDKSTRIYILNIVKNGYSYSFLMNSVGKDHATLEKDFLKMMKSVELSMPESLVDLKAAFQKLELDEITDLKTPANFSWSKNIENEVLPFFVNSVYGAQLSNRAADYVLLSDAFFKQLYCLNIKFDDLLLSEDACKMINSFSGKQMSASGIKYEEMKNEPWDKMPKTVFLHQFKLLKKEEATLHYIFYCQKNGKTVHVRFQMPLTLEKELEECIFSFIQQNFKE